VRVAIHQPQYWPWPRYVHKILSADVFVYLDTVQFSKNGVQNRNQVKCATGACWLTLPVRHHRGQTLIETQIADTRALEKHWRTLVASYGRTEGFARWGEELRGLLLDGSGDSLCGVAIATTEWLLEKLEAGTRRLRASELPGPEGRGSDLVSGLCSTLKADVYLTGAGALDYMQPEDFRGTGCEVQVQEWLPLEYEQVFPKVGFVPDLSTLDLLLTHPASARAKIEGAGSWSALWSRA
jgi:hypothetical protein